MDKKQINSRLNKIISDVATEIGTFGKSALPAVWVEVKNLENTCRKLKIDSELNLDLLENFSIVEFEKALVISYFASTFSLKNSCVIRASIPLGPIDSIIALPSLRAIWPMIAPWEEEAHEMFGIQFEGEESMPNRFVSGRLPEGWTGFPLRKNYKFPKEFLGIIHSRPFNTKLPKIT